MITISHYQELIVHNYIDSSNLLSCIYLVETKATICEICKTSILQASTTHYAILQQQGT